MDPGCTLYLENTQRRELVNFANFKWNLKCPGQAIRNTYALSVDGTDDYTVQSIQFYTNHETIILLTRLHAIYKPQHTLIIR